MFIFKQLFDRMCMALGGRAAEAKIFRRVTTGIYCQHLKYFGNVYGVLTNHIGNQNTRGNQKLITVNKIVAYSLVISRLIGFFFSI